MPNDTAAPERTTLQQLRQPLAPEQNLPAVRSGMGDLQGFELMQRVGKALAASTLVPKDYQGNLPNCLVALEMAQRIGASPLMVTQNLYVVHGRPGWSAKFLIASFNQCGRFSAVRFEWQGVPGKDEWGCRAWATEKATGEKITGPLITIALSKKEGWYEKNGSKWKTIPELMLMYRAAAWMINTHAPEISMGLNTAEEISDVYDATRGAGGEYEVTVGELRNGVDADGVITNAPADAASTAPTFDADDFHLKVREASSAEDLDYLRGLVKEAPEGEREALSTAVSKRAGEIAAQDAKK